MSDEAPRRVGMWGGGVPIPTGSEVRERLCIFNIKMVSFVRSWWSFFLLSWPCLCSSLTPLSQSEK